MISCSFCWIPVFLGFWIISVFCCFIFIHTSDVSYCWWLWEQWWVNKGSSVAGLSLTDGMRSSHIQGGTLSGATAPSKEPAEVVGHLIRMPPDSLPLEVFRAWPTGRRPRGWPRTCWRDYISDPAWDNSGSPRSTLNSVWVDLAFFDLIPSGCHHLKLHFLFLVRLTTAHWVPVQRYLFFITSVLLVIQFLKVQVKYHVSRKMVLLI